MGNNSLAKRVLKKSYVEKSSLYKSEQLTLHIMLFLPAALTVVFAYIPIFGIIIAFKKYKPTLGFFRSSWVGFENFLTIFLDPSFARIFRNTLSIAVSKILAGLVFTIFISLLLNEIRFSFIKRSIQTVIYLPYFISWVLMAGIIRDLLALDTGLVNQILQSVSLPQVFFLGDNRVFPAMLVVTDVLKGFGWGTIIYLAAISGIDPTIYEAAEIDGANRLHKMIHITLPGISAIIILLTTLNLGNVLNAGFDQIFNLVSPVTFKSGDVLDTLIYRLAMESNNFSLSTACGLFKSAVSVILILTSYKLADKFAGYRIF